MFCSNCGTKVLDGAGFCQKCGARVMTDAAEQQQGNAAGQQGQAQLGRPMMDAPKKKKPRKLFIIVAIIFALLVILLAANADNIEKLGEQAVKDEESIARKQAEAVNLSEIYTNEEEGFSFKDPNAGVPISKEIRHQAADYVGEWGDMISQRCMMSIAAGSQGEYLIEINWSSSASENTHWSFVGTFDSETGGMVYSGSRTEEFYPDGGDVQTTDVYTDGAGRLFIGDDGMLYWEDDKENAGKDCIFEKL